MFPQVELQEASPRLGRVMGVGQEMGEEGEVEEQEVRLPDLPSLTGADSVAAPWPVASGAARVVAGLAALSTCLLCSLG